MVVKITADGHMDTVWSGLTAVTGIVVAPDGSLYASEMATGNETKEGMRPNTGRIVRQTGPASLEEVVTGLNYPIDLEQGPDGDLYVAGPAYGGSDRDGWILKVEPSISHPVCRPGGPDERRPLRRRRRDATGRPAPDRRPADGHPDAGGNAAGDRHSAASRGRGNARGRDGTGAQAMPSRSRTMPSPHRH